VILARPFRLAAAVALIAVVTLPAPLGAENAAPSARPVPCAAPADITRLQHVLPRTARRLAAAGQSITIVAIGSSSTAGAGASTPAASYPSRLAIELRERFPGRTITVVNRGANGEEASDMLARFEQGVIAENPDLVLWQVGTNSVLRDHPILPAGALIRAGIERLKAAGADIVLIDSQFAPKVLAKRDLASMLDLLAATAKENNVDLFHRFAVMRYWRQVAGIPFETFLSPDELHMNDWSYACVAKLLAGSIAEAATRSALTATGPKR
jgi:acyl-CoA thioesterase-1